MRTRFTAMKRAFSPQGDASLHTEYAVLASFAKLKSGSWPAQARRKGKYVIESFLRRKDAEEWALDVERRKVRAEPAAAGAAESAPCHARAQPVFELALDHADRYRALAVGRGGAIALGGVHKPRVDLARAESVSE